MITDVSGLRVGHWSDEQARTGCSVVLFPQGTVASAEIRGGAPAERELALLEPSRAVNQIDALLLTGGSAFGLAAADGVMRFCEEQDRGVPTPGGKVPIVPALGLFDLAQGDASVRPGPAEGYAACQAARAGNVALGRIGAGTGAMTGYIEPLAGTGAAKPGGLTSVSLRRGDLVVSALVVVNAFGVPGADDAAAATWAPKLAQRSALLSNTTIGLVATNASLDKLSCLLVAQAAHHGLARVIYPSHTRFDGDAFVAAATGEVTAPADEVCVLATHAVAQAIRSLDQD